MNVIIVNIGICDFKPKRVLYVVFSINIGMHSYGSYHQEVTHCFQLKHTNTSLKCEKHQRIECNRIALTTIETRVESVQQQNLISYTNACGLFTFYVWSGCARLVGASVTTPCLQSSFGHIIQMQNI